MNGYEYLVARNRLMQRLEEELARIAPMPVAEREAETRRIQAKFDVQLAEMYAKVADEYPGARTHNLADISLESPREKLTVVTGVSGSGKSSLVFDTVYAEGQRRYVQSLSTYARLFLERMERPDVDSISDIPPALALRQKNTIKNARSTVSTVTEINDYLRLLFASVGRTICPRCGIEVTRDTIEGAAARIRDAPGLYVFVAPFELGSRSLKDATAFLVQNGYHRLFYDGDIAESADFAE